MADLPHTRFRCDACRDEHPESARPLVDGGRVCPECGHHVAEPIDAELEP